VEGVGVARCVLALGPDSAGGLLAGLVGGARERLDVAVYECGPSYAVQLAHAAGRGVAVRLLLDAHAGANSTSVRLLRDTAVECRALGGHPGVEAHWKLLLAGAGTVAVGSGNLVRRDAPQPGGAGTREWWAAVSGTPTLLRAASEAFETAWAEAEPPPVAWRRAAAPVPTPPPVGVPHPAVPSLELDDIEARRLRLDVGGAAVCARLAERVDGARQRVLATVPYVHTRVEAVAALLDRLDAARRRGAEVRLLLGTPPDPDDAGALRARSFSTRVMDPARSTTGHAKGLVADAAAVAGSANWSGAGLGGNREAALTLDDPRAADWFAAALDRDWEASSPL
jgi:phosphatidylserine/phosphatidylglycerophosphate/cardiolipin synthase-like enzyme